MSEPTAVVGGVSDLGIDAKAIIFQVINFILLLLILKITAYQPILKMLDQRRQNIKLAQERAREMEAAKLQWEKEKAASQQTALDRAEKILRDAEKQAKASAEEILQKAKKQQTTLTKNARLEIDKERQLAIVQVKRQAAALVTLAAEKVLAKKIDESTDQKIITRSLINQ